MRTLVFVGTWVGLWSSGCGSTREGGADAWPPNGDPRAGPLDASVPAVTARDPSDGSETSADGGVVDASAPDAGRWPLAAFCPPLDCGTLPTWEGPEGLDCPAPRDAPVCPQRPLVCPDDLSQLQPDENGEIEFTDCGDFEHGPECAGQSTCESCVNPRTGERWEWPTDTRCRFDENGRVVYLCDSIGEVTSAEYDEAGRVTSWDGVRPNVHRDWGIAGKCIYDAAGRCIWFESVEVEGAGGTSGPIREGACVDYNRAGQRTASAHFFTDDPYAFISTRCVAAPSEVCATHIDCEQQDSEEAASTCLGY